jgi:GNAT superfamily N-acetyltransferase
MRERPTLQVPSPSRPSMLLEAIAVDTEFHRFLQNSIGSGWVVAERRAMSDDVLAALLVDDLIRVFVLYVGGIPAGFFELDERTPDETELVQMGLAEGFRGRGLGRYLLAAAVETAWDESPARVWVRSTNLDDPRAVLLYQWAGFTPYETERRTVTEPDA